MIYQYIRDVEHVENVIELFFEFISRQPEQRGLIPSFNSGYLNLNEKYKLSVFSKANELLNVRKWNSKTIQSGYVAAQAVRAMQLSENNLVNPHQKTKFVDKVRANSVEAGQILFDFYTSPAIDESMLESLVGFFGRKYDTLAYLFFLKNWKEYLPCKPRLIQQGFDRLGIYTECLSSFTYKNYSMYNEALKELMTVLREYDDSATVLDAHSFVWIIERYPKVTEYIFEESRVDAADQQLKKEQIRPTKTRVNQTEFRKNVVAFWNGKCCVTGCGKTDVLIASHIKPWRKCITNAECVDPYNGLLLIPNVDRLFDAGYISFDDNGKILISSALTEADAAMLGVTNGTRIEELLPKHQKYLEYHRENVFVK